MPRLIGRAHAALRADFRVEPALLCEPLEQRQLLTLPPGFSVEPFVAGLIEPIAFDHAPDGRIFVAEKAGRVQIVDDGEIVGTFIDLRDEVNSYKARGLIGLALDPNFAVNQRVYLNYSVDLQPLTPDTAAVASGAVIRVSASTSNPNVADLSTRFTLLAGHDNPAPTHTVGDIEFDLDGNLIVSWGDGGLTLAYRLAAQNPDSLQGKIFRISSEDGAGISGNPYYESSNPFSTRSRVLAVGVRNAWRMSRDDVTGNIYLGDVTDNGPEEVNIIRPSDIGTPLNFGWPYFEGQNRTVYGTLPNNFVSTYPYISYAHIGEYDAITSGVVYRGDRYPISYSGKFLFANYGQDVVYTADDLGSYTEFGRDVWSFPVDIQLSPAGRIQMASIANGTLFEIVHEDSPVGRPIASAQVAEVLGLSATFRSSASWDFENDTLRFLWDFDGDGLTDSTLENPTHTFYTPGNYSVRLTVVDSHGNSSPTNVDVEIVGENIAVGKPAIQSSTPSGGGAALAVDGSVSSGSSLTGVDPQAWWEVDLQTLEVIGEITVFHQDDFVPGVIRKYHVLVADTPFAGSSLADALYNADWTYYCDEELTATRVFSVNQLGRYVRVQLAGIKALSLREVQVYRGTIPTPNDSPIASLQTATRFGIAPFTFKSNSNFSHDPNGDPLTFSWDFGDGQQSNLPHPSNTFINPGTYAVRLTVRDSHGAVGHKAINVHVLPRVPEVNLALGKPTTQSSTAYGGAPSRAVDGFEWGDHARKKSISHTARQDQPYWQVNLGQIAQLDSVTLFNRTDLGPNKLKDAWILVSNSPFVSDDLETAAAAPETWSTFVPGLLGRERLIPLGVQGRFLRVQLAGANTALALAEVFVRGHDLATITYNGHEYRLTSGELDWASAQSQAASLGGTLVVIDDAAENEWLRQVFGPGEYHIGLTDRQFEGALAWETNQVMSYVHLRPGEPNNALPDFDYGVLDGGDGLWRLGLPTEYRLGIIEIGPPLPHQLFQYEEHFYSVTSAPTTHALAGSEASALGGYLVTIDEVAENEWLKETFGPRHYFVGLNDQVAETQFRWSDGSSAVFTNFEMGEPNDTDGFQDAVIFSGVNGKWFDWSAGFFAYAIIEYD